MRFASVRGGDVGHLSAVFVSGSKKPARGGGPAADQGVCPTRRQQVHFLGCPQKISGTILRKS
jgi:hypothetical protein